MHFKGHIESTLKRFQLYRMSMDFNHDPKDTILLCADPRGGSTWLSELIMSEPRLGRIWEPLHITENALFRELGFSSRQHIPEKAIWAEAQEAFNKVLSGKNLNLWTTKYSSIQNLLDSRRLLIKMCRAGLLLPWITQNFSFDRKPIYIVRHPYAVVASQLRQGAWDDIDNSFHIPGPPYNEIYKVHQDFLANLSSPEQILTATWCLTNGYLLKHPRNNKDWISLTYEHLYLEPYEQLFRIYARWKSNPPKGLKALIETPSQTTIASSPIKDKQKQLAQWKSYFDDHKIGSMNEILSYFNITLYNDSILPHSRFT